MATQTEVVALAKDGKAPLEIADLLGISRNGVYQHLNRAKKNGVQIPKARRGKPSRRRDSATASESLAAPKRSPKVVPTDTDFFIKIRFEAQAELDRLDADYQARRIALCSVIEAIKAAAPPQLVDEPARDAAELLIEAA
jgi:hypothetical protein